MIRWIKIYFLIFIICPDFAFSKSLSVITANKNLLSSIEKHFNSLPISISSLQKFLLEHSYYSSELIQEKSTIVIKNPYKIIFMFKGGRFFKEEELRKLIKIDENKMGSFFYNLLEKSIKQAYQEKGFLKVKIEKTEEIKGWKKWVLINISEGPRIHIGDLEVTGMLSQPASKYEKFIIKNSAELVQSGIYNKKGLEKGYENLIQHLKNKGYLQSKIYSDRVFFKGRKAFVTVNLEEGPLIFIRDIQINDAKSVPIWEILSHIKSRIQATFKIDVIQKDLKRIEDLYKSKGYTQMRITNKDTIIKYVPGDRYVDIIIKIDEGSKAVISQISFIGLKKVKKELVKSLLKFKTGEVLTPLKKEESLQSLGSNRAVLKHQSK